MLKDAGLKAYAALIVNEPYVFEVNGKLIARLMGQQARTAIISS